MFIDCALEAAGGVAAGEGTVYPRCRPHLGGCCRAYRFLDLGRCLTNLGCLVRRREGEQGEGSFLSVSVGAKK